MNSINIVLSIIVIVVFNTFLFTAVLKCYKDSKKDD